MYIPACLLDRGSYSRTTGTPRRVLDVVLDLACKRRDDGRYGERGVRTALHIARVATLIGMPMGSYLLRSRTGAQDSTLPLEGLDAVASLTTPAVGFQLGK